MSSKKSTAKASTKVATHPTWIEMIKECIGAHKEDARIGVSRPQIKKFVETKYNLDIGAAQISQLSKALGSGSEKGIFVLPKGLTFLMFKPPPTYLKMFHKGPSGRVKLAPKNKHVEPESSDEDQPAAKVKPLVKAKAAPKPATSKSRAPTVATVKKPQPAPRTTATSKAASKPSGTARTNAAAKKAAPLKPATKTAPAKKTIAGKPKATSITKKTTVASKRGAAKKAVTGTSAPEKAKTAAKKAPPKKTPAVKATSNSSTGRKKTARK
ncbi:hypothetical protein PC9H_001086 [Pleurotus ostreatus]|uniref:Histone H1 n=1 Tax=Pleurotus ostreatus TaxID=5322 RepID=A0A8H7DYD2_PLEOS|nr:uncharacterized protein PC9H_001086 [Pleurotus ostreatus]KAF7440738.1 hypothetical protein PC9H_001086 [Pleurotus ostreatus]